LKLPLLLFLIFLLGVLSFILTYIIIRYSTQKKILVVPNDRSLHDKPTPSSGGIAIIVSWYIGITLLFLTDVIEGNLYFALLCGILLAIISLIDDIIGLKPIIRLIIHFITAIAAFCLLGGLRPVIIPEIEMNYTYIIYPLAIIGIVWFINLFNFMDGVDGFASVQAIIICAVLFVFTWSLSAMLIIACITGFLYWNWPKARIFMGDIGSTQLGFILVILGIYYHNILEFSILNWIMLASPFWFDATLTLFRRWRIGEKLSQAHCKHAYQRIVQAGYSHEKVNLCLIIINLVNILMISLYREIKILQVPLFLLTLLFYYLITRFIDRKVPFANGKSGTRSQITEINT
jgi:UDP-N-acetylmuramyl pentapeptide phosphotransferase/UDP-N-acetylglucosamine-1-phosphate transferase